MLLTERIKTGVYTVAEMSANHAGKLENALRIVRAAKAAGADCLKIQTYSADTMTIDCDNAHFRINGGLWDGYKLYDLYREAATPWEWQERIKAECDAVGIDFLSTAFDKGSADFLAEMGVCAYKIASFELVDIPLIRHVAAKGKPMIVSCGMAAEEEIAEAMDAMLSAGLREDRIVLLKCTSEYPARFEEMNLATIPDMARRFGVPVGFSDHSLGGTAAVVAVALGAVLVEKHFCLSRGLKSPDSAFSCEPDEFADMVRCVRAARDARGTVFYGASEHERNSLVFRRSIFAVRDIAEGETLHEGNIRIIRPGYGAPPKQYGALLGRKSSRAYKRGEPIHEGGR
jgi:N-acetylneuraminate synthase/pseudaminic acid synthase